MTAVACVVCSFAFAITGNPDEPYVCARCHRSRAITEVAAALASSIGAKDGRAIATRFAKLALTFERTAFWLAVAERLRDDAPGGGKVPSDG